MAKGRTVQDLLGRLADAMESATPHGPDCQRYIERLAPKLRGVTLAPNPPNLETETPDTSWNVVFGRNNYWKSDPILQLIGALGLPNRWWRADDFYPEPEYRHFSKNVWGAPIAGQETALFNAGGLLIAMLIIIDSHTTYPLHSHRIEELCYMISGTAEWSRDGKEWIGLGPGTLFHNTSYQPHSMRTSNEPLMTMALYLPPFGWEGGLLDPE